FIWKVTPNGAWKNGNAPLNIYVGFYNSKSKTDKNIKFTIANPYILDEQYTGAAATTPAPEITGMWAPAKPAPFPSVLLALSMLFIAALVLRR
ncbi:MAG: hypothetical protein QSU88_06920, partial [Candidatus Methanoperedens sp.]|nr:hypothetical protein [Candidatus Methanoperedens sp.]